jgi:phosphate transport system substrate-binding protein
MRTLFSGLVVLLFLAGCGNPQNPSVDTPTSGHIRVAIDETLQQFMQSEVETFNSIYTKARVDALFLPEQDAFKALLNDSVGLIVSARGLNEQEKAYFESIRIIPRELKIATDGVALIVNRQNADSVLTISLLRNILQGNVTTWGGINSDSKYKKDKIVVVFDNSNSSTVRFLRDSVNEGKALPSNCYSAGKNENVIDYVARNPLAIGVLGISWLSDLDDSRVDSLLQKVSLVAFETSQDGSIESYTPDQAYIALKKYPLVRNIYMIDCTGRTASLAGGFTAFVAGDKGQRIILKAGLVPATGPVRIVNITDIPIKVE